MTTYLNRISFFNAGFCRQFAWLAGRKSWGIVRFNAVFAYVEHPDRGAFLIDTGYGDQFWKATSSFPQRLYRWVTPTRLSEQIHAANVLASTGIDPMSIQGIFISHFHADHIAGLNHFPHTRLIYRDTPLRQMKQLTATQQLHHGFLPSLIPEDMEERSLTIDESSFRIQGDLLGNLRCVDYWGDGSLYLVDLPGHALGHMGFLLNTPEQPTLYVVDACWELEAMRSQRTLPILSRRFQHDYAAYLQTQMHLRELVRHRDMRLLACHCTETQRQVVR